MKKYSLILWLNLFALCSFSYSQAVPTPPTKIRRKPRASSKVQPAPKLVVPQVDDYLLRDGLKTILAALMAYGLAIGVVRLVDSAAANQHDDIGPFHQFITVGTFCFGFYFIPGMLEIFFGSVPNIFPFSF